MSTARLIVICGLPGAGKTTHAMELVGAKVELHYLHAPLDVLFERVRARAGEDPPITERQLRGWSEIFEPPDEVEGATWDRFVTVGS